MKNVMEWCENPVPLSENVSLNPEFSNRHSDEKILLKGSSVRIFSTRPVAVSLYSLKGSKISDYSLVPHNGVCHFTLERSLSSGSYILVADNKTYSILKP